MMPVDIRRGKKNGVPPPIRPSSHPPSRKCDAVGSRWVGERGRRDQRNSRKAPGMTLMQQSPAAHMWLDAGAVRVQADGVSRILVRIRSVGFLCSFNSITKPTHMAALHNPVPASVAPLTLHTITHTQTFPCCTYM